MEDPITGEDRSRFLGIVKGHLKLAEAQQDLIMDADLDALGLDSQAALSLMLDLEEAYGVTFPDALLTEETFATPQSLWDALQRLHQG